MSFPSCESFEMETNSSSVNKKVRKDFNYIIRVYKEKFNKIVKYIRTI